MNKNNTFKIVIRGDKRFVMENYIPMSSVKNDFELAYEEALKFKQRCELLSQELMRIYSITEYKI